jgi:hypothetical protein
MKMRGGPNVSRFLKIAAMRKSCYGSRAEKT